MGLLRTPPRSPSEQRSRHGRPMWRGPTSRPRQWGTRLRHGRAQRPPPTRRSQLGAPTGLSAGRRATAGRLPVGRTNAEVTLNEALLQGAELRQAKLRRPHSKPGRRRGARQHKLPASLRAELFHHLHQQLYHAIIRYHHRLSGWPALKYVGFGVSRHRSSPNRSHRRGVGWPPRA